MRRGPIPIRSSAGVAMVDVEDRLTSILGCETLCDAVRTLLGAGHRRIVLNFSGAPQLGECGIGELIGLYIDAVRTGGELSLLNVDSHTRALLRRMRLYGVLRIEDEGSARGGGRHLNGVSQPR